MRPKEHPGDNKRALHMIQIWDGTEHTEFGFEVVLKLPMPKCDKCRQVIHDLKHNHWPEGKMLAIVPDKNPHGVVTGFHAGWVDNEAL